MLSAKQIEGVFGIFLIGTLVACIASGRWLMNGEMNIINAINSFHVVNFAAGGGFSVPSGVLSYWNAFVTVMSWNYPYLASPWCLFIKIPLWIVSAGMVIVLIQMAIQVVQGIVGLARSIIGG
jgi:hypothetical protein